PDRYANHDLFRLIWHLVLLTLMRLLFFLLFFFQRYLDLPDLHSFPTRRSSDLHGMVREGRSPRLIGDPATDPGQEEFSGSPMRRSEEHTSELQSHLNLVCRLLLEKKKK